MAKYVVMWKYASSYVDGTLKAGEVVELDEAVAEMINKDSPGVLVASPKGKVALNRMVTSAQERGSVVLSQAGAEDAMTTANFGAVRLAEHRKGN